jgi:hypothetical protein
MKRISVLILSVILIYSLSGGTPSTHQWDQYLGNPGRTAYIDYDTKTIGFNRDILRNTSPYSAHLTHMNISDNSS